MFTYTNVSLGVYHIIDSKKHTIYGYVLLRYENLFKYYSSILLNHHYSYEDINNFIDNILISDDDLIESIADGLIK